VFVVCQWFQESSQIGDIKKGGNLSAAECVSLRKRINPYDVGREERERDVPFNPVE